MAPLTALNARKKGISVRLTKNSKIFKTIIKAIQDKKGENIVSLDLRKVPEAVADFFIVCQATSTTQIKAISDHIEAEVYNIAGEKPYKHEGYKALHWVLIDYVNIVVHVMHPEARKLYQLEEMWSDAVADEYDV